MQCPSCGHMNAEDARFCAQCGTRLALTCAVCGTQNEPGGRFCTSCGSPLEPSPAPPPGDDLSRYIPDELLQRMRAAQAGGAMRGERRTVTMLFADIQGSTAAAEQMDPEDWAEIINGAFVRLSAPIYRYEGTLARLLGDAILAFFGAPIAHEDDPIRAVSAGLEIADAIAEYRAAIEARTGLPIAVRVGINTGLVVVGEVGSDLRVEYTALGDAINVAARMEQTAEPGTVRITEHTAGLLSGMFDLADLGPVEVKGKAEPVRSYRVISAATAGGAQADIAPLVARAEERSRLAAVADRLADGVGAICALIGEAGIGKSRLLAVLRTDIETRAVVATRALEPAGDLAWLEGRSRSFDTSVPYATFIDALRRWWDLDTAENGDEWAAIAAAVEQAGGASDPDAATYLAAAVGARVPDEHAELLSELPTPLLHQRTAAALSEYLESEAARQPVLLVLDDLHWGDGLSLALAERLMASSETAALALVLALRPYRDDASWRLLEIAGRDYGHRYTPLQLEALGEQATRELLSELLPDTALDDAVTRRVLDSANGNPLFIEELARSLREQSTGSAHRSLFAERIDVPASLSGLLTARLDQLDDAARLVAQVASVIGPEFSPAPLGALLDGLDPQDVLPDLVRRGILIERRRVPEPVYSFRHPLIQETAYSTVLLRTRRRLHAKLARHLEQAQPDAIQEIARHHLEAGDRDRAFPYVVQAGEHATRRMALSDAIQLFTTALDAVPAEVDPELVVRAHDGLGEAYGLIPDLPHAAAVYQQLFDYGRVSDRPSIQVTALNRLAFATATHTADFAKAEEYLADARRIAEAAGDDLGLAECHMNSCFVASMQGELERAIEHDVETVRLGTAGNSAQIRVAGLERRALNLLATTQYEEAEPAWREAIEAAEQLGGGETLAALRTIGGVQFALRDGDLARAQEIVVEGVGLLTRFGSFHAGPGNVFRADVALALGDVEGALAAAAEARRVGEEHNHPFAVAAGAACMAHCYALCDAGQEHDQLRSVALDTLAKPIGDLLGSTVWSHLGWAGLALEAFDQAGEDFRRGLEASSVTRFFERPRLLIGRALAALERAQPDEARTLLDDATTYAAARAIHLHDAQLALAEGLLARLDGREEEADRAFERAQRIAAQRRQRLIERDAALARWDLARSKGLDSQASRHLEHAQGITATLASMVADEQLREGFRSRSARGAGQPRPVTEP